MPQILVTGATGFIGRHLLPALSRRGATPIALVRPTSDRRHLPTGTATALGDLTDAASLRRAADRADAVVHLASLLKVPWKPAFQTVNVEGTRAVAAACAASGARLVVVSSLAAGPRAPVSRYGRVKRAAEEAARALCPRAPIVRPPAVFGPHDAAMLPLFRAAARGWHACPTRPARRISMIHVHDLADLLADVVLSPPEQPQTYYPAHAEAPAWDVLGAHLAQACGSAPPRLVYVPRPLMEAAARGAELWGRLRDRPVPFNRDKWAEAQAGDWLCDTTTATARGWTPRPLAERLEETARWYAEAGWL